MKNVDSDKTVNNGRVLSIDVLRGFLLILMVFVHFILYFGDEDAANTFTYFFFDNILADWGAAAFLMMMGMSQVLSSKRVTKPDNWMLFKRALLRGGYIFAAGLLMLILAWGPDELWCWDILTLMGFATVVLFFCRFLPSWFLIVLCCAIALLTPFIRDIFNIAADWGFKEIPFISKYLPGMFLEPLSDYHPAIVKGFFLSGYFAVLPWIIFSIIGFVLGRRIVLGKIQRDLPFLFITGVLFLGLGFSLAYLGRPHLPSSVIYGLISPLCFYPDSFSMINIQVGMSIIVFVMAYFFLDVRKKDKTNIGTINRLFIRTSNFSLTFYFLHYMLIGWPLAILYLITGKYMISDMLSIIPAFLCGIVAVALLEILIFFWGKAGSKCSLEWILAELTTFVLPGYKRSINKMS
ncbi:MAG: DUF1624 domain-containing protein [Deltaproteobacteria bacterium]|nr:DUF1624 domain-containing protein [Deltaproteobacteria bacterium]